MCKKILDHLECSSNWNVVTFPWAHNEDAWIHTHIVMRWIPPGGGGKPDYLVRLVQRRSSTHQCHLGWGRNNSQLKMLDSILAAQCAKSHRWPSHTNGPKSKLECSDVNWFSVNLGCLFMWLAF